MPTENDKPAQMPIPRPHVITNDPALAEMNLPGSPKTASGNTGVESPTFTGERVELPSRGAGYPKENPASHGFVMVRPITTKEEEILITERFHKQGIAIDMILSRCILTKGINTLDLISGDRLHILFYLRAISYGPEYTFRVKMKGGDGGSHEQEVKTDVSKLQITTLPENFHEPWPIQLDGVTYEIRLSRGKDEQDGVMTRLREKKKNPNAPDSSPTHALKRQIVSINGDSDPEKIAAFVDTMVAKRAARPAHRDREDQPGSQAAHHGHERRDPRRRGGHRSDHGVLLSFRR